MKRDSYLLSGGRIASFLSLEAGDALVSDTMVASLPGKIWNYLQRLVLSQDHIIDHTIRPKLAAIFDQLAFVVVCVLALVLGAPFFAGDKEGLACLVIVGLLFKGLSYFLNDKKKYSFSIIDILIIIFFAINVVACFASHYLAESLHGLAKVAVYTASYFLFVACLGGANESGKIKIALWCLLLSALGVAIYGLYQYKIGVAPLATWEDPAALVQGTRIYSTLGNPNLLAAYLLPAVSISLLLSCGSGYKGKWLLTGICLFCLAVVSGATILTGSRGGYLGLFASFMVFVGICASWLWQRKAKARVALSLFLVLPLLGILAVNFVPGFEERLLSIFAGREHTSNSFRMNVWGACWRMFLDNWWLGVGVGNQAFRLAYGLYMVSGFDALGSYSVPLEIVCETGIFGLIVFVLLLIVVVARAHVAFWRSSDPETRFLIAGVVAAIAGLAIQGLVDTVFYRPQVHLIFWLLMAILTILFSSKLNVNQGLQEGASATRL